MKALLTRRLLVTALLDAVAVWASGCKEEPPPRRPTSSVLTERPGNGPVIAPSPREGGRTTALETVAVSAPREPGAQTQPDPPAAGSAARATNPSPSPVEAEPSFQPLLDAVVGEWAVYSGLESRELRYRVLKATPSGVTIRVSVHQDGKPLGLSTTREEPTKHDPVQRPTGFRDVERRISRTSLRTAGRLWDARLYEDRWTDEEIRYSRRTWVSPEAPVFGILRMELRGDSRLEAQLELESFGKAAGRSSATPGG